MTYRSPDGLEYGVEPARTTGAESIDDDVAGELPGRPRRGAHSSDRLSTETGVHRYTYQRPPTAPTRTRARHAAPSDDTADPHPPFGGPDSGSSWTTPERGRDAAAALDLPSWRRHSDQAYDDDRGGHLDDGYRPHHRTSGVEPTAWDQPTLSTTAGVRYDEPAYRAGDFEPQEFTAHEFGPGRDDRTARLTPVDAGTLTATRPPRAVRQPYPAPRVSPEAETEIVEAIVEAPIIEAPIGADAAPTEVPVPFAPATTGGRLRFLGKKHVGLRVAAVSVLVVGSAIGIAVGVLRDSDPDTVKVTDDIQADAGSSAVPTQSTNAGPTQAAPVGAELLIKQRQQAILDAAQKLAAGKAAAARSAAAATAERAEHARASRSASKGTTGDAVPTAPVDCDTYSGNRATGCALLQEFSFDTGQMDCLDKLWTKESQWTTTAENPSGAYGIPQALPGSKMASVADDWQTNPATQIRWGLGYIKGKYGTPCAAWSTSEATGSY